MILLTGYGPFGEVRDNPSAALVRSVQGMSAGGHRLHALALPVSWRDGPSEVLRVASEQAPALIVGFGVATLRTRVEVEAQGTGAREGVDVLGQGPPPSTDEVIPASVDVAALARLLDANLSTDAGRFLCNAWIAQVTPAVACPAVFVHLPPDGMAPERLLAALDAWPAWSRRY